MSTPSGEQFRAALVREPGAGLAVGELPVVPLGEHEVRVRVLASGVCGADVALATTTDADARYPVVPGHEIAGVVEEIGPGVRGTAVGDRVAVGWFGGSCGYCDRCRRGDVVHCAQRRVPGRDYPGGWAQYVTVPADAVAHVPSGMDLPTAAPFGCAGVTVFNAIRRANLPAGGTVAVFGVGGLGHLAIQFAAALGHLTIAIARGTDRREQSLALGAHHYLDSTENRVAEDLNDLGGADLIVYTAAATAPAAELVRGLALYGQLVMVGVDGGTITVPVAQLVTNGQVLTGHLTGSPLDTEQAMAFALAHQIRPIVQTLPLAAAATAVEGLRAGTVRFRSVLLPWEEQ